LQWLRSIEEWNWQKTQESTLGSALLLVAQSLSYVMSVSSAASVDNNTKREVLIPMRDGVKLYTINLAAEDLCNRIVPTLPSHHLDY
jgi:predicted acyl esterase